MSTNTNTYTPCYTQQISDWDCAERLWEQSLWGYLRVNPEDHTIILTEPPLNPPEAREATAEIFFETFSVPALYIGVQAVLALYASLANTATSATQQLTGTVIDSGDGCTHVVPVVDGYVVGSAIKSIPIAGKDVTMFVQQLLRDRGEVPAGPLGMDAARRVKEGLSYVCSDMVAEFTKYDGDPGRFILQESLLGATPRKLFDVAYERFLGPEIFFTPSLYSTLDDSPSLPSLVDSVVQRSPIDARRRLYGNIVLSGGSTMFKNFGKRLQRDVKRIVETRRGAGGAPPDVKVVSHSLQRYAVWCGGSIMGAMPDFSAVAVSRALYEEVGASCVRRNAVFVDGA